MNSFWKIAARHWPPSLPSWEWEAAIGASALKRLSDARVLQQRPLQAYNKVPCAGCRGDALVLWEGDRAVAVCSGDFPCAVMELGSKPCRLWLDEAEFAGRVAEALGLAGIPGAGRLVVPLGRRQLGEVWVAVDLVAHPVRDGLIEALQVLVRGGPGVRVLLIPHSSRARADLPTEVAGVELLWVGLDEVVRIDGDVRADWAAVTSRRRFAGLAVERRFAGLEVGNSGIVLGGSAPPRQPTPLALHLLRLLAATPGEVVTRRRLFASLWPDDHTRKGTLARGTNPDDIDRRLRNLVGELREVLGRERVPNRRGSVESGGYCLDMPVELVRVA